MHIHTMTMEWHNASESGGSELSIQIAFFPFSYFLFISFFSNTSQIAKKIWNVEQKVMNTKKIYSAMILYWGRGTSRVVDVGQTIERNPIGIIMFRGGSCEASVCHCILIDKNETWMNMERSSSNI